jgi:hypothetical protein
MNNEQITMNKVKCFHLAPSPDNALPALPFFFVLFSFLFCMSCQNPFEPPKTEKPATAELGYFSLMPDEPGAGRTIMPITVQDDFAAYTLEFVDSRSVEDGLSDETAFTLVADLWKEGELTSESDIHWYSFTVTSGTTYRVWWNDSYQGDGTNSAIVEISATYSDNTTYVIGDSDWVLNGWTTAQSFTANRNDTVYIRVRPYDENDSYTGTYGIVYSTGNTRPGTSGGTITNPIMNPDVTEDRTNDNLYDPIPLSVGVWNLYITAYMDAEKTKPAAQGRLKGIIISGGETTVQNVTLEPFAIGIGEGTFSWNIDYPSNVDEATITFTRLPLSPENEQEALTIFLTGAAPLIGSIELQTGYYRVVFKLINDAGLETERRDTLHIYQNMESFFEFTFTDSHFNSALTKNVEDFGTGTIINGIFRVATTAQWNAAVSAITNGGNDKNYIIHATANFTITGHTTNTFGNVSGVKISLRGEDNILTLSGNGNILRIGSNQNIILRDMILRGHNSNDNSLVYVANGGTFTMQSGQISGNTSSSSSSIGGGGGVYVGNNGAFTMNGGTISSNSTMAGGGGVGVYRGTFTMNGGTITGNTSPYEGGGGVRLNNGAFTMNGGIISSNTYSGFFSDVGGGGVYVYGTNGIFTMNGGTISGNSSATFGGGVFVYNGGSWSYETFYISTGTIYGSGEGAALRNTASLGGGALYRGETNSRIQFGTFNSYNTWYSNGTLDTTDETIRVADGVLQSNFNSLSANPFTQTTMQLIMIFNQPITGLTVDDISLSGVSGAQKETLSGSGTAYTLTISITGGGGELSVAVAKSGYNINGSPKTVTISPLIGTVSISGTAQVGQTLTANTNSPGSGDLSYQWKRISADGETTTDIGINSNTYAVQSADLGSTITVTVTRSGHFGSVTSNPTAVVIAANQNPVADDFIIGNLNQRPGSVTPVTIAPKAGKSDGEITIYYNGSTTLPSTIGTYTVTFNVAMATGWNAANGLAGGTLTIDNQDPVASDFDIGNLTQTWGSVTAVTIAPKAGKSTGTITIYYNESDTLPTDAGTYTVTFNVAMTTGWNAASGLTGGTLTINRVVSFSISFAQISDAAVDLVVDQVISLSGDYGEKTVTLKVDSPEQYTSIEWYIPAVYINVSGDTFILDSENTAYNSIGDHFLTLEVWKDGKPYNKTITFTVVE